MEKSGKIPLRFKPGYTTTWWILRDDSVYICMWFMEKRWPFLGYRTNPNGNGHDNSTQLRSGQMVCMKRRAERRIYDDGQQMQIFSTENSEELSPGSGISLENTYPKGNGISFNENSSMIIMKMIMMICMCASVCVCVYVCMWWWMMIRLHSIGGKTIEIEIEPIDKSHGRWKSNEIKGMRSMGGKRWWRRFTSYLNLQRIRKKNKSKNQRQNEKRKTKNEPRKRNGQRFRYRSVRCR